MFILGMFLNAQVLNIDWSKTSDPMGWTYKTVYTNATLPSGFTFSAVDGTSVNLPFDQCWSQKKGLKVDGLPNKDLWLGYTISGLTPGDEYELTTNGMVQNLDQQLVLYAWDKNDNNVPTGVTVTGLSANYTYTIGTWAYYTKTFEATSSEMTFGIGSRKTNAQVNVSSFIITKLNTTNVKTPNSTLPTIYPNPATGECVLQNQTGIVSYAMFNNDGLKISETKVNGAEKIVVNMANIAHGLYLIKITDTSGKTTITNVVKK